MANNRPGITVKKEAKKNSLRAYKCQNWVKLKKASNFETLYSIV